ncbi:hypothetical protein MACK_003154 [Theileria orientalis]|uniref:Uncharacterized protein n=1 Tax=Theileria orientalis TaxID=68886 RepID=A0A976SI77_THEOR|nr:hypothetical protein MACK_003154 [Theileria orientalis]
MNRFIFSTIFILININLINCDETETKTPIDVDLNNIKSEDFDILKSIIEIDSNGLKKVESYKLTPKTNKKINSLIYRDSEIWNTEISAECQNITIYNLRSIYFVIKTLSNNVPNYFYLRLNNKLIGAIGVLSLVYDMNYPLVSNKAIKTYSINISSPFDKLYVNYLFKQGGRYRYESFEPNEGEGFAIISDNTETIWVASPSVTKDFGMAYCKKVRVFKEEVHVRDRETGRLKFMLVYRFLVLVLNDGMTEYRKLDIGADNWDKIDINEFNTGIKGFVRRKIFDFDSGEASSSDSESDKNKPYSLDIFKRDYKLSYSTLNFYPFRIINLFKYDTYRIDEITYNNKPIIKYGFGMFTMNIFNTPYEWYHVELVVLSYVDLTKVDELSDLFVTRLGPTIYGIYYKIYDRYKEANNISRSEFLESMEHYITDYTDSNYVKYSNIYELQGGSEATDLSEEIRLKINPDYTKPIKAVVTSPVDTRDTRPDDQPVGGDPKPVGVDNPNNPNPDGSDTGGNDDGDKKPDDNPTGDGDPSPDDKAGGNDDGDKKPDDKKPDGVRTTGDASTPGDDTSGGNDPIRPDDTIKPEDPIKRDTKPSGQSNTTDSTNNTTGNTKPPSDPEETAESLGGSKGEPDEEDEYLKESKRIPSESASSKINDDEEDNSNFKATQTSESGDDVTIPKPLVELSVVAKPVVKFFHLLGPGGSGGENKNGLRALVKKSGFISSISKLSILIITASMLI